MNEFLELKERLEKEGWWIGSSEDMMLLSLEDNKFPETHPHTGKEVDWCKVLWWKPEDVLIDPCVPEGLTEEEEKAWEESFEKEPYQYLPIEEVYSNRFCFNTDEKSVENIKDILPIIEECGCNWTWNKSGDEKILISWA